MKRILCCAVILGLVLPPALLRPDDPPSLPKAEDIKDVPDASADSASAKADVEVPSDEPVAKKESVDVVHEKPSRFSWGNFLIGAFGGAVLAGGVGILVGAADTSSGSGSVDSSKIAILCGGGAVAGGLLSLLLGATAPPAATPPDMKSGLPQGPSLGAAPQLVFRLQF
jgi:hypothetical protein